MPRATHCRDSSKFKASLGFAPAAPIYLSSGYIGRGDFWKFGLIFGVVDFAGLLVIVLPWLEVIRWQNAVVVDRETNLDHGSGRVREAPHL